MYQLMFAIIAGLIVGAIAERMKYSAIMRFSAIWMFVGTSARTWWGDGLMNGVWNAGPRSSPSTSRAARSSTCRRAGRRSCSASSRQAQGLSQRLPPHSLTLTMVGTGMLWVGW
jgi:Amt family ammonium transporter